jgi:NAD(P)-dependent dehydrogenase (short-subunit alcohol dehydrogenase family)
MPGMPTAVKEAVEQHICRLVSPAKSLLGGPRAGIDCTSKGAVDSLTRTLACKWARHSVLVNALAPTVVETEFARTILAHPEGAARL